MLISHKEITNKLDMRQEEIVNEIRKKCGNVKMLSFSGWYFIYNKRHFFYIPGKNEDMVQPHSGFMISMGVKRIFRAIKI